jgi:hypothetical protein
MTASKDDIALVAQAMAANMAAESAQDDALEAMQISISGSEVYVDPAPTEVDDVAASWPAHNPGQPPVAPVQTSSANVQDPLNVGQSSHDNTVTG